jgi:hypothetical protein
LRNLLLQFAKGGLDFFDILVVGGAFELEADHVLEVPGSSGLQGETRKKERADKGGQDFHGAEPSAAVLRQQANVSQSHATVAKSS